MTKALKARRTTRARTALPAPAALPAPEENNCNPDRNSAGDASRTGGWLLRLLQDFNWTLPPVFRDEILGVALVAMSVILLTGLVIESSSILSRISCIVSGILGSGAYLFSLVLWLWGIDRFRSRNFFRGPIDYAGWGLALVTVILVGETTAGAGGTLGATLWPLLVALLGLPGAIIALVAVSIISMILVVEILFSDAVKRFMNLARFNAAVILAASAFVSSLCLTVLSVAAGTVATVLKALSGVFSSTDEDPDGSDRNDDQPEFTGVDPADGRSPGQGPCGPAAATESEAVPGTPGFAGREIVIEVVEDDFEEEVPQDAGTPKSDVEPLFVRSAPGSGATGAAVPESPTPGAARDRTKERGSAMDYISRLEEILGRTPPSRPAEDTIAPDGPAGPVSSVKGQPAAATPEEDIEWEDFTGDPEEDDELSDAPAWRSRFTEDAISSGSGNPSSPCDAGRDDVGGGAEDTSAAPSDADPEGCAADGEGFDEPDRFDDCEDEIEIELPDSSFELPPISLLDEVKVGDTADLEVELRENGERIIQTLGNFSVQAKIERIVCGPSVTQFQIKIAKGVKVSRVQGLVDNIGYELATSSVRIEAPIPGHSAIGIEIPNSKRTPVFFREVMEDLLLDKKRTCLTMALGKDIAGRFITADLASMPHLLVAGSTGSGKSVCMNTIICSMLFEATPSDVKFIMVDPKMVEMAVYKDIPHLMVPPIINAKEASAALTWCVDEMERRYEILSNFGIRHIDSFNKFVETGEIRHKARNLPEELRESLSPFRKLPYIVVIIDELADLMMVASKDVETSISRLAAKARAVGIHLVIATQRPSVNVITGVIKANLPSRIAFAVSAVVDSKTILDHKGAEKLLGKGDMLFAPVGQSKPTRLQGAFISDDEVMRLTDFLREQGEPEYNMDIVKVEGQDGEDDIDLSDMDGFLGRDKEIVKRAAYHVIETNFASASGLQRSLRVGYARAGRIIDTLEKLGVVSAKDTKNNREILMTSEEVEELFS